MPDPSKLPLFLLAAGILLLTPGPAVLYIVARSADQGRLAGLVSVLGIETGNLFHVLAATLGLSALLFSSAMAFTVVKYLGAAYLIWIGVRRLLARDETPSDIPTFRRRRLGRVYRQGVIVAALNPKTALFFLAFLPQFVDPAAGSAPLQCLTLGALFVLMAIVTDGAYALLADAAGRRLRAAPVVARAGRYVTGGLYIGLGVTAALADGGRR